MEKRNKETRLAWWHSANGKQSSRRKMIKFFYGLSLEQYEEQLKRQRGVCALCGRPPSGKQPSLSIYHEHNVCEHVGTKRGCLNCVRGLLCFNCNRSILPVLEKFEHLQTEFVKKYLRQRPFMEDSADGLQTVSNTVLP